MKYSKITAFVMATTALMLTGACKTGSTSTTSTVDFIVKDSANKMLQSYLNSVNYAANDTALLSASVDADQLRLYLVDSSIKGIKIMLAHNLAYINAGNSNKYAGTSRFALTFVLAGVDAQGNYKLLDGQVLNRVRPCPVNCPPGTASSPIIQ